MHYVNNNDVNHPSPIVTKLIVILPAAIRRATRVRTALRFSLDLQRVPISGFLLAHLLFVSKIPIIFSLKRAWYHPVRSLIQLDLPLHQRRYCRTNPVFLLLYFVALPRRVGSPDAGKFDTVTKMC